MPLKMDRCFDIDKNKEIKKKKKIKVIAKHDCSVFPASYPVTYGSTFFGYKAAVT
jgi:hypothetical protein